MALTKHVSQDKIEIVGEFKHVQVRTCTKVLEDGVELSSGFHRHVVSAGDDYSAESTEVQAICAAVHTDTVVAALAAHLAASAIPAGEQPMTKSATRVAADKVTFTQTEVTSAIAAGGLPSTTSASDPTISSNPPAVGHLWINSTSGEQYIATSVTAGANVWVNTGEGVGGIDPFVQTSYLVIAGGGGGADGNAGGGAGGYRNSYLSETSGGSSASESPASLAIGVVYTITVGAAGARGVGGGNDATDGGNSSLVGTGVSIISTGGAGGNYPTNGSQGGNGGSGSGDTWHNASRSTGGLGIAGQGTNGGTAGNAPTYYGGGGGGAGTAGTNGTSGIGTGGNGLASSITGSSVTRAGGGGGGSWANNAFANGGTGGGGSANGPTNGTTNTGSGGGGAGSSNSSSSGLRAGSSGGSGVVILRMLTSKYSGTSTGSPTVSTSGSDTILIFNGSGSYTAQEDYMAHFAQLNEVNTVVGVQVVDNSIITDADGVEQEDLGVTFLASLNSGGWWKQTSYNGSFRKNYAGVGFTYDAGRNAFIAPKPYPSWVLVEDNCQWEAPTAMPDDGQAYEWNEDTTTWKIIEGE